MAKQETTRPRLAGAVLCAVAALLLVLCSLHLLAGGGGRWGAGALLFVGLGLGAAAMSSLRPSGRHV